MVAFVDTHRATYGVESICAVLPIAPSTYHRHKATAAEPTRRSARAQRDDVLRTEITRVFTVHRGVYGVRNMWRQLEREPAGSGAAGVRGHAAGPAAGGGPHVRGDGFAYTAVVIDLFSRRIVGWRVARSPHSDLALAALEQATADRQPRAHALRHHSDRGAQYLAIRYTTRLLEAGIAASAGSRGDSYDNALAESVIGLYKTELIHRRGPWRGVEDVDLATLEWVWWFNHERLLEPLGYLPPIEFEEHFHRTAAAPAAVAVLT